MAEENNGGQGAGTGEGAGNGAPQGTKAEAFVNPDGTVKVGDKVFISKESHEVIAGKLREKTKVVEDFEKSAAEAEKKRLEEQGEFKTLAEKAQADLEATKATFAKREKINALRLAAVQAGTVDADAVAALANLEEIKVSEDGAADPASVKTVLDTLKKEKPYLFGTGGQAPKPANAGNSGGAPAGGTGEGAPQKFKRSQLQDSKFYQENRTAILAAASRGDIEDDVNG